MDKTLWGTQAQRWLSTTHRVPTTFKIYNYSFLSWARRKFLFHFSHCLSYILLDYFNTWNIQLQPEFKKNSYFWLKTAFLSVVQLQLPSVGAMQIKATSSSFEVYQNAWSQQPKKKQTNPKHEKCLQVLKVLRPIFANINCWLSG